MKSARKWLPLAMVPMAWLLLFGGLGVLVYCGFRFYQFDLPMLRGEYEKANENEIWITSPEGLYNQGLSFYIEHDYDSCRKLMMKAYAASCDASGRVKPAYRLLAADAQLYIGNSYMNLGKDEDAVSAFEDGLRLRQGELYTIYNLEKLQDADKSKSGEGGKTQPKRKI